MSKFRPQFAPRPSKGALVASAKKQVAANETKAKMETLATVDKGEVTAADVAVIAAAVAGDQNAAAEAIVAELQQEREADQARGDDAAYERSNDVAAASPTKPELSPPVETGAAAASPAPARAPKGTNDGQYVLGKRYSPKTDRNSETWGKICKALADGPKTMKELAEAVKGHGDFLGYMTRGGHIIPHKVEEKVSG